MNNETVTATTTVKSIITYCPDEVLRALSEHLTVLNEEEKLKQSKGFCFGTENEFIHNLNQLSSQQRSVYDCALQSMTSKNGQLVMFLSGESGTGKSFLVELIAKGLHFASYDNSVSENDEIVVTATNACNAFAIGGQVWQKALFKLFPSRRNAIDKLSPNEVKRLRSRLSNLRLMVVDGVNLLSLEDLSEIDLRLCTAKQEFTKPFGGVHILLSGDFFQLKPIVGTSIVDHAMLVDKNVRGARGRFLFEMLTHYATLSTNFSYGGNLTPLSQFVREARMGKLSRASLDVMNQRVTCSIAFALKLMPPSSLWIAGNLSRVNRLNSICLQHLTFKGNLPVQLVAVHRQARANAPLNAEICRALLESRSSRPDLAPAVLTLCVGSRVRLTKNIAHSLGLYVGVMGTVLGFAYGGAAPPHKELSSVQCGNEEGENESERPVVLVQIDGDVDSFPYSCSNNIPRLIPVVPVKDRCVLTHGANRYYRFQYPLLPAHCRSAQSLSGLMPRLPIVIDSVSQKHAQFSAAQYVALSRIKSMEDVIFLEPMKAPHGMPNFRTSTHNEYTRLSMLYSSDNYQRLTTDPCSADKKRELDEVRYEYSKDKESRLI